MPGTTRRVIANNPFIFVSIMISHSSRLPSNSLSTPITSPALFISKSISAHSGGNSSNAASICPRSRTSQRNDHVTTLGYSTFNSYINSSNFEALRAFKIKSHPSFANLRAQALPIPLVAPVIKTILLSIMFWFIIFGSKSTP